MRIKPGLKSNKLIKIVIISIIILIFCRAISKAHTTVFEQGRKVNSNSQDENIKEIRRGVKEMIKTEIKRQIKSRMWRP